MSDTIDKLIDAKIVSDMEPLRGDIRQGIHELMEAHASPLLDRIAELEKVAEDVCKDAEMIDGYVDWQVLERSISKLSNVLHNNAASLWR